MPANEQSTATWKSDRKRDGQTDRAKQRALDGSPVVMTQPSQVQS